MNGATCVQCGARPTSSTETSAAGWERRGPRATSTGTRFQRAGSFAFSSQESCRIWEDDEQLVPWHGYQRQTTEDCHEGREMQQLRISSTLGSQACSSASHVSHRHLARRKVWCAGIGQQLIPWLGIRRREHAVLVLPGRINTLSYAEEETPERAFLQLHQTLGRYGSRPRQVSSTTALHGQKSASSARRDSTGGV